MWLLAWSCKWGLVLLSPRCSVSPSWMGTMHVAKGCCSYSEMTVSLQKEVAVWSLYLNEANPEKKSCVQVEEACSIPDHSITVKICWIWSTYFNSHTLESTWTVLHWIHLCFPHTYVPPATDMHLHMQTRSLLHVYLRHKTDIGAVKVNGLRCYRT